jgi:hypothetical protein
VAWPSQVSRLASVGNRYTARGRFLGREFPSQLLVTECVAPERLAFTAELPEGQHRAG